jgi:hypothetical protein
MKLSKSVVFAMLPVAGLLVASAAAGRTLTAYMDVNGGFPDGTSFPGCYQGIVGLNVWAEAHGFDKNNNSVCSIATQKTGSGYSQSTTCDDSAVYHEVLTYQPLTGPGRWGNYSNTNGTPGWNSTGSPNYLNTSYSYYPEEVKIPGPHSCTSGIQLRGWSLGSGAP